MIKSYLEKLLEAIEDDIETSSKKIKKEEENLNFLKDQKKQILRELSDREEEDGNGGATTIFFKGMQ